jgi:hypothetical protein
MMVVQHFLRVIKEHLGKRQNRSDFEAAALQQALQSFIPGLQKMAGLDALTSQVSMVVDGAVFLVRCFVEPQSD